MNTSLFLKLYAITLPIFFAIDMVWLGLISKNLYQRELGYLMKANVNWAAGLLFYLLFIVGLVVFVIAPALQNHSWVQAVLLGALLGLISYATYDLTNLATIKDWPVLITVIDLAWGMTISASVSVLAYLVAAKVGV